MKRKTLIRLGCFFAVLIVCLLCIVGVTADDESQNINDNITNENLLPENEEKTPIMLKPIPKKVIQSLNEGLDTSLVDFENNLPSSYDLRNDGYITPVRNQKPYGTCWAFSMIAPIESNLLKTGLISKEDADTLNLSELQMVYFVGNREGVTKGTALPGFESVLESYYDVADIPTFMDTGFEFENAIYQILSGIGIANEDREELNYSNATDIYNGELLDPELAVSENQYYLKNVYLFSIDDKNAIKTYLLEKGAASIAYNAKTYPDRYVGYIDEKGVAHPTHSTEWENDFQNETTEANHGVTLVGWDDNYPKEKFANLAKNDDGTYTEIPRPEHDGAWLIKNSWGTGTFTDVDGTEVPYDGYFWLSYEDPSIGSIGVYFYDVVPITEIPEKIYQYDGGMGYDFLTNDKTYEIGEIQTLGMRNIYTITGTEDSDYEKISAVLFPTANTNVAYTLKLKVNGELRTNIEGTEINYGEHMIELPTPVYVKKGDIVDVQIELFMKTTGDTKLQLETDAYMEGDKRFFGTLVTNTETPWRSFVKFDESNNWIDISTLPEKETETTKTKYGPARIKVYSESIENIPTQYQQFTVNELLETISNNDFSINLNDVYSKTSISEAIEITNLLTQKPNGETTAKSPFPILGILAGLGAAGVLVMRRR